MLRNKVLVYFAFLTASLFAKDIIAILDLEQIGLTPQEAQILTDRLTTELISLDRYQVVERTNMDKILKEQKFQHSGCTDSECAVEIGQLLNTDYIVIGSVSKFGTIWFLDARLIDVGQGKSLISAKFSREGEMNILLTSGITSIANQLCELEDIPTTKIENEKQKSALKVKSVKRKSNRKWNISTKIGGGANEVGSYNRLGIITGGSISYGKINGGKFGADLKILIVTGRPTLGLTGFFERSIFKYLSLKGGVCYL